MAVLAADRLGSREAIAEAGGEFGVEGGDRLGREPAFALADGGDWDFHGFHLLILGIAGQIRR